MRDFNTLLGHQIRAIYVEDNDTYQSSQLWFVTDAGTFITTAEGD